MPWPIAHGPDIHGTYQQITGQPMPEWPLFSHKISEGANTGDRKFPERWTWMREKGFKYRGAYHWLRSDSKVVDQVNNVIRRLDAQDGLLKGEFVQSDWETTPGIYLIGSKGEREFCDRLEQYYQRFCTITYSSDWIPDSPDDSDIIGEFYNWLDFTQGNAPLWYANYNSSLTSPTGGWKECEKYSADIWQFTSSYYHPSIISVSGGGFDMNHILNWDTLNRISGYENQTEEEANMKSILYTVTAPTGEYSWFLESPDHSVRQVRNGNNYQNCVEAGALPKNWLEPEKYPEHLSTLQPVGALGTTGKLVLGAAATADWEARAIQKVIFPSTMNVAVTNWPPPSSANPGTAVEYEGEINLRPKSP